MSGDESTIGASQDSPTAQLAPSYEMEQYIRTESDAFPDRHRREIRRKYGYVRSFFRIRSGQFGDLQRWLNQAQMGENFDEYLTRGVEHAAIAGLFGAVLGVVLASHAPTEGLFAALDSPVPLSDGAAAFLVAHRGVLVTGALGAVSGLLLFVGVFGAYYYDPRLSVYSRRRNVNLLLPHAIVYMYALSYGGLRPLQVVKELADAEDTYGEVAAEFGIVERDVERFGNDLTTAIQNVRNLTSNDNLEQFLDDMLGVLDSGSDFTAFLEEESQGYRNRAENEQEAFLATLEILSEVFVVAFVAAPLFLLITLVLVSLLGGQSLWMVQLLVYAVLPVGMCAFLVVVHYVSLPFATVSSYDIESAGVGGTPEPSAVVRDSSQYGRYRWHERKQLLVELLRRPYSKVTTSSPLLSLSLSVPVALVVLLGQVVATGSLAAAYASDPIGWTSRFVLLPLLIVAVPLSVLYEQKRRRAIRIARRFPDTLNRLASANQMGIPFTEALGLVSGWSSNEITAELRKTHNEIQWCNNPRAALLGLGNRLGVPQVKRTMTLTATGLHSTSDLSKILSIAAKDTRIRHDLDRSRRKNMNAYVVIVAIGFLVYLAVVVLLDHHYLVPVSRISAEVNGDAVNALPIANVTEIPVSQYRTLLFHSAIVQGAGSGLLAGKLTENELLAGLKYSIVLVVISIVAFTVV